MKTMIRVAIGVLLTGVVCRRRWHAGIGHRDRHPRQRAHRYSRPGRRIPIWPATTFTPSCSAAFSPRRRTRSRPACSPSRCRFNLALQAGFGAAGKVDPLVVPQTFNFFIIGDFWSVQAQLEYKPKSTFLFPSDIVTMTGDAVHRIAPHAGEFAPGPAVPFNVC